MAFVARSHSGARHSYSLRHLLNPPSPRDYECRTCTRWYARDSARAHEQSQPTVDHRHLPWCCSVRLCWSGCRVTSSLPDACRCSWTAHQSTHKSTNMHRSLQTSTSVAPCAAGALLCRWGPVVPPVQCESQGAVMLSHQGPHCHVQSSAAFARGTRR